MNTHTSKFQNYVAPSDMQQRLQAIDIDHSVAVIAPAGSGKTSLLLARFLNCLNSVDRPEEVLAITFTNDAAAEIRERVLLQIGGAGTFSNPSSPHEQYVHDLAVKVAKRDAELNWNLMVNPQRLRIMTIDAYSAQLVNSMPVSTGVGGAIKPVDDPRYMYREAVINVLGMAEDVSVDESHRAAIIDVLGYAQYRYETLLAPMQDLLSKRDQWLLLGREFNLESANRFLQNYVTGQCSQAKAVLMSKGGSNLASLLNSASGYSDLLGAFSAESSLPSVSDHRYYKALAKLLLTGKGTIRKTLTVREGFDGTAPSTADIKQWLKDNAGDTDLEGILQSLLVLPPVSYEDEDLAFVKSFFKFYELCIASLVTVFERYSRCDFTEIALRAHLAIGTAETGFGDAALKEEQIKHLMIDEMQDTSYGQIVMISLLLSGWADDMGIKRSLFLCGDCLQSIYKFRGAESSLFQDIWQKAEFAGLPLTQLSLSTNFRSAPVLVDHFNEVFRPAFSGRNDLFVTAEAYKTSEGAINYKGFTEKDFGLEAELLVADIKHNISAHPDKKIAILARNRSHFRDVIKALRDSGIPYGGKDLVKLVDMTHVRPVLSLLNVILNASDRLSWIEVMRSPLVGLDWKSVDLIMAVGGEVDVVASMKTFIEANAGTDNAARAAHLLQALQVVECEVIPLSQKVKVIWMALKGHLLAGEDEQVDVDCVFNVIRANACGDGLVSVNRFNQQIESIYSSGLGSQVTLMTFHGCKGLEFDQVYIVGLSREARNHGADIAEFDTFDGTVLMGGSKQKSKDLFNFIHKSKKEASQKEELRILYVALTRAKSALTVYCGVLKEDGDLSVPLKSTLLYHIFNAIEGMVTAGRSSPLQLVSNTPAQVVDDRVNIIALSECAPLVVENSPADPVCVVEEDGQMRLGMGADATELPLTFVQCFKAAVETQVDGLAERMIPVMAKSKHDSAANFIAANKPFVSRLAFEAGIDQQRLTDFLAYFARTLQKKADTAILPF